MSGSLRTNQGTEAVTHVHTPPLQLHTHHTHTYTHTHTLTNTHTRGLHRASACMLGERTPDYATAVTELLCRSATGGGGHVRSNVGHLLHKVPWRCACEHSWSVRPGVCWTNPLHSAGSLLALCLAFGTPASEVCVLIARGRTIVTLVSSFGCCIVHSVCVVRVSVRVCWCS